MLVEMFVIFRRDEMRKVCEKISVSYIFLVAFLEEFFKNLRIRLFKPSSNLSNKFQKQTKSIAISSIGLCKINR
jgi:hypothetical protein